MQSGRIEIASQSNWSAGGSPRHSRAARPQEIVRALSEIERPVWAAFLQLMLVDLGWLSGSGQVLGVFMIFALVKNTIIVCIMCVHVCIYVCVCVLLALFCQLRLVLRKTTGILNSYHVNIYYAGESCWGL